ncbi:MAG: cobalamin-binding protein [Thermoplasmata archaeon]|nr:cobalamin-binding protein [Thermoplasmata archaeon]
MSALGHGAELVGRSSECDYPASVLSLPVVMAPRTWDSTSSSGQIDARVTAARSRGESLYTLDAERLRQLQPDVLLTQDLCGVCSVTGPEVEQACESAGIHPTVVSLTPRTLDDVWTSIEVIASALNDPSSGTKLAGRLRTDSVPTNGGGTPRVAVLEWLDPPLLAGLWTPEMVIAAGGVPVGTEGGSPGVRTQWGDLQQAQPDLVVVSPCSFSVARTRQELADPVIRSGLAGLTPKLGIFVVDEAYFSRPGPRLGHGISLLRHLISQESWQPPMPVRALDQLEVSA